jgi:hypothetical protein
MARLGEQLIAGNVVSAEKVEQALRAQVVWGGRLGTNLIELGAIDLDELSRALGQQHGVPAALARHFEKADPELQAQLPVEVAKQFCVVPLVRLSPERIAVVALDALSKDALEAIAAAYEIDPRDGIVYSVAAEMRVLYHLERVYKIPRSTRFLRSKGATIQSFEIESVPVEIGSDADVAIPIIIDEALHPTGRAELPDQGGSPDDIAAMIDQAIENATTSTVDPSEPQGRDRRTYVRTLGEDADSGSADIGKTERLGRIAIKRVVVSASAPTVEVSVLGIDPAAIPSGPTSLSEAMRAIKRGPNRDRVAELVVETLREFVPACDAALLLVVRGTVAIGWKHFARGRDSAPEVAVPLDEPGIVPAVIAQQQLGRCTADDLGPIDALLMRELGGFDGELVVAPIMIGSRVMCLVAGSMQKGAETDAVDAIATAAGAAFARLIRDASR